jgi:dephospho-CoA kinase
MPRFAWASGRGLFDGSHAHASVGMAPNGFAMTTASKPARLFPVRVIGLLGGIASGKSLAAGILAEHGLRVLDADRAGHEAVRLPEIIVAARERWGDEILDADGQIDRGRLAKVVFGPGEDATREREYLERLTHPEIARLLVQEANRLATADVQAAVLDAAVMIEAGWDKWCDKLVFIEAPRGTRLQRALARGWKEEDFIAREAAQESLNSKRQRADVVIDNSGTPLHTRLQIERFLPALLR